MKQELLGYTDKEFFYMNEAIIKAFVAKNPDAKFRVTIENFEKEKSKAALGYFFAEIVTSGALYFDMEEDDWYNHLCMKCGTKMIRLPSGEMEPVIETVSKMDFEKFQRFLKKCVEECQHWGFIPETPEEYKDRMYRQAKGKQVSYGKDSAPSK